MSDDISARRVVSGGGGLAILEFGWISDLRLREVKMRRHVLSLIKHRLTILGFHKRVPVPPFSNFEAEINGPGNL